MNFVEERIITDGKIGEGNILKVDSFLNHQLDIDFIEKTGREFYNRFGNCGVNRIVTIEASGIGIACITAQFFNVPVIYAKKSKTLNLSGNVYSVKARSYTRQDEYEVFISKDYLHKGDRVLIIDDFLAQGNALKALVEIMKQAGAVIAGVGIVIEKPFSSAGTTYEVWEYRWKP